MLLLHFTVYYNQFSLFCFTKMFFFVFFCSIFLFCSFHTFLNTFVCSFLFLCCVYCLLCLLCMPFRIILKFSFLTSSISFNVLSPIFLYFFFSISGAVWTVERIEFMKKHMKNNKTQWNLGQTMHHILLYVWVYCIFLWRSIHNRWMSRQRHTRL